MDAAQHRLEERISCIKNVCLILSGKGGVGKSSIAVQLALSLLVDQPGASIGLLDIDLTGPSIPRMLGLDGHSVHQSAEGWVPVYLQGDGFSGGSIRCMSIAFLLHSSADSIVWRGPKKTAMIRQFLSDVRWGELDWLIVDTPPGALLNPYAPPCMQSWCLLGTSDEHISLLEQLQPLLSAYGSVSGPALSSILVTTPQAVSISDVSKELSFARQTSLPVIGLIENMSGYLCPHCGETAAVFGRGGGEAFCDAQNASDSGRNSCRFLGRLPIDSDFLTLVDHHSASPRAGDTPAHTSLLERYMQTQSFSAFKPICQIVVASMRTGAITAMNMVDDDMQPGNHKSCSTDHDAAGQTRSSTDVYSTPAA